MNIGYSRAKEAPETPLIEAAGDSGVTSVAASAVSTPNNSSTSSAPPETASSAQSPSGATSPPPPPAPYTEKEIYILALIDSLPYLLPETLFRWLTPVAELVAKDIKDIAGKGRLRRRFWEVLSGGELDVERAEVGVRWWSEGGRGLLEGDEGDGREDGGDSVKEEGRDGEGGEKGEGGKEEMTKMLMEGEKKKMEKKEHPHVPAPAGAAANAVAVPAHAPTGGRQRALAKL